jgi:cytoskeletal protein CcmA (bactofilin family)
VVRVSRTFVQRFVYSSIRECKQCKGQQVNRRSFKIDLHSSRCPHCHTERLTVFKRRDGIDRLYKGPLSILQGLLGANLYHCPVCRLQFYDLRGLSEAAESARRSKGWERAPAMAGSTSPKPPSSFNTPANAVDIRRVVAIEGSQPAREGALIGTAITVIGHIQSEEDLYLEGEVEGSVDVARGRFTIGRQGKARAMVTAREVVVLGVLHGNVEVTGSALIGNGGEMIGDIHTPFIRIDDGANMRGKIDIIRETAKSAAETASR